jgi:hypothetical protein
MNEDQVQKLYVNILSQLEKLMEAYRNAKEEAYQAKTITDFTGAKWRYINGNWVKISMSKNK